MSIPDFGSDSSNGEDFGFLANLGDFISEQESQMPQGNDLKKFNKNRSNIFSKFLQILMFF